MKIIDGKGAVLGRLASYSAKQALKGEEIVILNCDKIIISGNKRDIKEDFKEKRRKGGSSQKGPKYSILNEKIVKRCIRGMLPNFREGRGRVAYKKIKCYTNVPKQFENLDKIKIKKEVNKFIEIKELK
jgi:large subunit ribosomal protein L13